MSENAKIGNRTIGKGYPCFITAELGINHNGDMFLAKKMIRVAKDCGADAVKLQYTSAEDFLTDRNLLYTYSVDGRDVTESQYDMFKRCELSYEMLKGLKEYSDDIGILLFATPSGKQGLDDFQRLGISIAKLASDSINDHEMIVNIATKGMTMVMSTGMANVSEVKEAVSVYENAGGKQLIILHCISLYPTSPEDVNLLKIPYYISQFEYPIGFSDHTIGIISSVGAVAYGATFIEKHFTLDRSLPGPDQKISADPKCLSELVLAIREIEKNIGTFTYDITEKEKEARKLYRLSCVASCDIKKGDILGREKIAISRPGSGIAPSMMNRLINKRATKDIAKGKLLEMSDVEYVSPDES